eukprot:2982443-Amphidinium_carterae.2
MFGVFRITPKQPDASAPAKSRATFGGYQASCPFHAKSRKTRCKKKISLPSHAIEHKHEVWLRAAHWCTLARACTLQSEHLN